MGKGSGFSQGLGIAFRLGTEITAATIIGALMGYAFDWFAGSKPWGLAAGIMVGGAAGCLNVYRVAQTLTFDDENNENENPPNGNSEDKD